MNINKSTIYSYEVLIYCNNNLGQAGSMLAGSSKVILDYMQRNPMKIEIGDA
jgi:hypothetical protein